MESTGVYWKPVFNVLEDANIKLSSIASNTFGASGKRIINVVFAVPHGHATLHATINGIVYNLVVLFVRNLISWPRPNLTGD